MAEIKAFKGLRYTEKAGDIGNLCCPPYDIINPAQHEALIRKSEHNLVRLELPAFDGCEDMAPYKGAAETLRFWLNQDILRRDEQECIYIYEMAFNALGNNYTVKGFVSLVKLEPFSKGVILPHEETLSKAKTDRFNLMKATGSNFSQIYSLYMDEDGSVFDLINAASQGAPHSQFTDSDNVTHRLWCVSDPAVISAVTAKMSEKSCTSPTVTTATRPPSTIRDTFRTILTK